MNAPHHHFTYLSISRVFQQTVLSTSAVIQFDPASEGGVAQLPQTSKLSSATSGTWTQLVGTVLHAVVRLPLEYAKSVLTLLAEAVPDPAHVQNLLPEPSFLLPIVHPDVGAAIVARADTTAACEAAIARLVDREIPVPTQ